MHTLKMVTRNERAAFLVLASLILVSLLCKNVSKASQDVSKVSQASSRDCPTWTYLSEDGGDCECGDNVFGAVHCDKVTKQVEVNIFYCMTFSSELNRTVAGCCLYTNKVKGFTDGILYSVPNETSHLDEVVCGHLNRTGQMCGSCIEGFAPPVYSYSLACVECSDYKYNWLKYIAVAYLPLTLFYFIVVFFRINTSSPSLSVYVLLSQLVGIPPVMQLLSKIENGRGEVYTEPVSCLYGLWNLDFFRIVYKPFCLHPSMTMLHTVALDYAIAVYPLALVVVTYIVAQLHDKYSLVVWLWTPFRKCFSYFRKEWNLSDSLIGAFGTFLFLSYMKILYTSFSILVPTDLHDIHGYTHWSLYVLYDGRIRWFGRQHLPFAILALFMSLLFNFLPLFVLCLYPCSCFQHCLNRCRLNFRLLHVLMDTIHGGYKLEPKDYRHFASLYLIVRIVNLTLFSYILYIYDYLVAIGSFFMLCTFIVAVVRPYKKTIHNVVDTAMLLMFGYVTMLYSYLATVDAGNVKNKSLMFVKFFTFLQNFGIMVPPLYGIGLFLYAIIPKTLLLKMKTLFEKLKKKREKEEELLPHQLHQYLDENSPLLVSSTHMTVNINFN